MLQNVLVYYTPVELKHLVAVLLTRSVAARLDKSCSLKPSLSHGNYMFSKSRILKYNK